MGTRVQLSRFVLRQWNIVVLAIFIYSLMNIPGVTRGAGQLDYYNLVNHLFANYNKNVRPTTAGELTLVRINLLLKSVVNLDEKNQILESYATLDISWDDDYLDWDIEDYGNISRILYPQKQMWVPDIINENSVESQVQMGYDQLMCSIDSEGGITWRPSEIFRTSCDIDVSYYPFDTQQCRITFTTMMSTMHEIDIDPYTSDTAVGLNDYSESATWKLIRTSVSTPEVNDNYTRIEFTLTLKRLRLYYALNMVMPVLLLSMLSSAVFYLPAESGEKVGMAITILLSFTVYLTIIAEKMPETSAQVSLLEVFIAIQLTLSALSVILSVIVLNLHHRDADIPISEELEQRTRLWRKAIWLGPPQTRTNRNQVYPARRNDDVKALPDLRMRRSQTTDTLEDTLKTDIRNPNSNKNNHLYELDHIPPAVEEITWIKIAQTLDRILFGIYTMLTLAVTIVIVPLMIILGEVQS